MSHNVQMSSIRYSIYRNYSRLYFDSLKRPVSTKSGKEKRFKLPANLPSKIENINNIKGNGYTLYSIQYSLVYRVYITDFNIIYLDIIFNQKKESSEIERKKLLSFLDSELEKNKNKYEKELKKLSKEDYKKWKSTKLNIKGKLQK